MPTRIHLRSLQIGNLRIHRRNLQIRDLQVTGSTHLGTRVQEEDSTPDMDKKQVQHHVLPTRKLTGELWSKATVSKLLDVYFRSLEDTKKLRHWAKVGMATQNTWTLLCICRPIMYVL